MPIVIDNTPYREAGTHMAISGERQAFSQTLRDRALMQDMDSQKRRDSLSVMDRMMRVEAMQQAQAERQQAFELLRSRLDNDVAMGFLTPEQSQMLQERVVATGDINAGFEVANRARMEVRQQEADQIAAGAMAQAVRMAAEPYIQFGSLTADQADNVAQLVASGQMDGNQALLRIKDMSVGLDRIREQQEQARAQAMAREAGARALRVIAGQLPEDRMDHAAEIIMAFEDGGLSAPQAMAAIQSLAPPPEKDDPTAKAQQAAQVQVAKERLRELDKKREQVAQQYADAETRYRTGTRKEKGSAAVEAANLELELLQIDAQRQALEERLGGGGGAPPAGSAATTQTQPAAPAQPGVVQPAQEGGSARETLPPDVAQAASAAAQQAIRELGITDQSTPQAKAAAKKRAREILAEQAQAELARGG